MDVKQSLNVTRTSNVTPYDWPSAGTVKDHRLGSLKQILYLHSAGASGQQDLLSTMCACPVQLLPDTQQKLSSS